MKQISIRLDDDLHARFVEYCDKNGTSMQKEIEKFASECMSSDISEPKFSKDFLDLYSYKPHIILQKNGINPGTFLRILEKLEKNFKETYKKRTNKGFYEFLLRVLRIFVGKKL